MARICADEKPFGEVSKGRKEIRDLVLRRGKASEREWGKMGLPMMPDFLYRCPVPIRGICGGLERESIFLVPDPMAIRVSVAYVSEEKCGLLPERIKGTESPDASAPLGTFSFCHPFSVGLQSL